jgi:hypothetical protein
MLLATNQAKQLVLLTRKKGKFTLEQAMKAQRGSTGIVQLHPFFDFCTRRGWVVETTPQLLLPQEKDSVPTVQEAGWAPGLVSMGAEDLASTGILSPDCPAYSELL